MSEAHTAPELTEQQLEALGERLEKSVDQSVRQNIEEIVPKHVSDQVDKQVKQLRYERAVAGFDKTGLDADTKSAFAQDMIAMRNGTFSNEKAALLEESDQAGGYLVPTEVHRAIQRIAATNGFVARDATRYPMGSDKMTVPVHSEAEKEGEYTGEDQEASESDVSFQNRLLEAQDWYVIFRAANAMLNDANQDVADFLMTLASEGYAARLDREGFQGGTFTGSPFVGILGSSSVTTYYLGDNSSSGSTSFKDFDPIADASRMIAQVPDSILSSCAFWFDRTTWAEIRAKVDSNGQPIVQTTANPGFINYKQEGIKPSGMLWEYPVYTTDKLPGTDQDGADKRFCVFGSLKNGLYFGDRERMRMAKSEHATVGGVNLFKADQTAFRMSNRHALSIGHENALVVGKTAAS